MEKVLFFISHLIFLCDITIVNSNEWIFWIERSTVTPIFSNATLIFQNNEGSYGGALSMYAGSQIELCTSKSTSSTCNSSVITAAFRNNHAGVFGGAVYVEDSGYVDIL